MRTYVNLLICVMFFSMSGCYKMRGRIKTTTKIVRIPIETNTQKRIVRGESRIILKPYFEHENLVIRATQTDACVDDKTTKYERTDYVHKALPDRYRKYLVSSLALTGTGALLTPLGALGVTRDYPDKLGNVSKEKKNDKITSFAAAGTAVGAAVGSIGITMLVSSIVDAVAARDKKIEKRPEVTTKASAQMPCNERPASGVTLQLGIGRRDGASNLITPRHSATTEANGVVRIPILKTDMVKGFRFSKDFLTVSCDRCKTASVTLPPKLSVKVVVANNDYDEIKEWLSLYPNHSSSEAIRIVYSKLNEEKKQKESEEQARAEAKCSNGDFATCLKLEKLREYYERDCKKNAESCFKLGQMYRIGEEGAADQEQAAAWYSEACRKKYGEACTQVGNMRLNGDGVKEDIKAAQSFYKKGCRYGDDEACRLHEETKRAQKEAADERRYARIQKRLSFEASDYEYSVAWGRLTIEFDVTAEKYISTAWFLSEARCTSEGKIFKDNSTPHVIRGLAGGDSSLVSVTYFDLPDTSTFERCELRFGMKKNIRSGTATVFDAFTIEF